MSHSTPEYVMMCPICMKTMKSPIIQCKNGHSMCGSCMKESGITKCPCCRGPLSEVRNLQLEQLIEGVQDILKLNCIYLIKGCKFAVSSKDKETHELECKFRKFQCEGKHFANWKCQWSGDYSEIYEHFRVHHKSATRMEYKTEATMRINLSKDMCDIQIISFLNGQNYFYYKHKIDKSKQKVYWAFQLIGLSSAAKNFIYEFELSNGVRKLKITEMCTSDACDINEIFNKERCVAISFTTIKNYLNEDGKLPFKFRIMFNKPAKVK